MPNMISAAYFFLSLLALVLWGAGICYPDCSRHPGFLGVSWYLWGLFYYSLAGTAMPLANKAVLGPVVTLGTLLHWQLTITGFIEHSYLCPYCLLFLFAGTTLNVVYLLKKQGKLPKRVMLPGVVLLVIALLLIMKTPVEAGINKKNQEPVEAINRQQSRPREIPAGPAPALNSVPALRENLLKKGFLLATDKEGNRVFLDLNKKKAVLFTSWCKGCDVFLARLQEQKPKEMPLLVAVWDDKKEAVEKKLAKHGLSKSEYFLCSESPVQKVPRIIWWENGVLVEQTANDFLFSNK